MSAAVGTASKGDELAPGASFGGYQIVRKLGAGAFGAVYEALRMPLGKRAALKVLHREFIRHEEVVERFVREAEIVARMEHPHIVGVFDVGTHDDQPFIAMEFLAGESLANALEREGTLQPAAAIDLMLAVMSAVSAVHDKGIVHRDLKPDNIFIAKHPTGGTQPKLLDFGIAKVLDAEKALTLSNAIMGTPYYMSPEQAHEAKNIDAKSDQWSLAVILYECLTGMCPFAGDSMLQLLTAITTKTVPRLGESVPSLPQGLDDAVFRAMQRATPDRWPSVREFGAALLPFASVGGRAQWAPFYAPVTIDELGQTMLPTTSGPSTPSAEPATVPTAGTLEPSTRPIAPAATPAPGKRRFAVVAAAALAAAALAAGLVSRLRPPEPAATALAAARARPAIAAPPPAWVVAPMVAVADAGVVWLAAPTSTQVAASPVATLVPAREAPGRHSGDRRRAVRPSAHRVCPNGVCAPD